MSVLPLAIFNIGSGGQGGEADAHESCGGYCISQTPESDAMCFNAHWPRFLEGHKTSDEVVHDSFPSTEITAADGATFLPTRDGSRPRLAI